MFASTYFLMIYFLKIAIVMQHNSVPLKYIRLKRFLKKTFTAHN